MSSITGLLFLTAGVAVIVLGIGLISFRDRRLRRPRSAASLYEQGRAALGRIWASDDTSQRR